MGTIVDELIVSLSLDPKKFQQGQKEAVAALKKLEEEAARGGKNVEKSVGNVEESFALLQKRLIGVAALLFGGLSIDKFIEKMTKLNVATANLSGWTGVSAQNLRSWSQAAEMAGVSGGAAAQGFSSITRQRTDWLNNRNQGGLLVFQRGANTAAGAGRGTGVDLFGGSDHSTLLPDEEVTSRLHKWLQSEIKAGRGVTGRAALRDNANLPEEFVTMLANPNLMRLLEEAKKNAPTNAEVESYKKLNEASAGAQQKIELLAREMVNMSGAVPALTEFFKFVSKTIDYWNGDPDAKKNVDKEGQDLHDELRKKFGAPPSVLEEWAKGLKDNTDELKKLRQHLDDQQKKPGGGGYFDPTSAPGTDGGGSLLHNIMYSGGGASGGGGVGGGGGGGSRGYSGGAVGGLGGDPDFGQQAGPLHGPAADYLAEKRRPFAEQLKDPALRRLLGAIISAENPGAGPAVAESLMNRTELVNAERARKGLPPLTLKDMILGHRSIGGGKSFYGPVRNGAIRGHLNKMDGNGGFAGKMNRFIDQAIGGSDLTRGHTDQGSAGDPNYSSGGVGVNINRERFNDWGFHGSRAWRQQRQREMDDYAKGQSNPNARVPPPVPPPDPRRGQEWTNLLGASRLSAYSPGADGGINTSSHMSIGSVHVHTAATDAGGIASAIKPALQRFAGVMSSNNGPT